MSIKIITTEDGSHSLFDEELNETYHSTRGARGESLHVFIREGLDYWMESNEAEELKVLEVGLGTGLNAFLTALYANEKNQKIHFTSLEPYPIEKSIYENLNFHRNETERKLLQSIHTSEWGNDIVIAPYLRLRKSIAPFEDFQTSQKFQVIFFDAFAPSKQPDVWSLANLEKCFSLLEKGGVLTTYCAQGQFKRNMATAGFEVETLQGAMGKKEMVRGIVH